MGTAGTLREPVGHKVLDERWRLESEQCVKQTDLAFAPAAGDAALDQREQNRLKPVHSGQHVRYDIADPHGFPSRLANNTHEARHGLHRTVARRKLRIRTIRSKAGDRAIDQSRLRVRELFIVEAKSPHHTRPKALHDDITDPRQLQRDGFGFRLREIQTDASLVSVDAQIGGALIGGIIASFSGIIGYKVSLFLAAVVALIAFAFTLRLKSRDEQIETMKANQ